LPQRKTSKSPVSIRTGPPVFAEIPAVTNDQP
jgi:hypothetical protein